MTDVIEVTERVVEVVDVIEQGLVIQGGGGSTSWNSITGKPTFTDLATSNETDEDIEITDETKGFIRKSPNGTRWRLGVSNSGVSVWTPVVMFMVLAMTLCGAMAQPVTGIGTTTNGTVVTDNTNVLTWSNAFAFTNGADSTTRTNLFGSDIPLVTDTNNNVISSRAGALVFSNAIGVGADVVLTASGLDAVGFGSYFSFEENALRIGVIGDGTNVFSWDGATAAMTFGNPATTRTNLGLGGTNTPTFAGLTLTTLTNATPQVAVIAEDGTVGAGNDAAKTAMSLGSEDTVYFGALYVNNPMDVGASGIILDGFSVSYYDPNTTWSLDQNGMFYKAAKQLGWSTNGVVFPALTNTGTTNIVAAAEDGTLFLTNIVSGGGGVSWTNVPSATNSAGVAGQLAYTNNYLYICTDTNTWRRVQLGTW
jgi:hypothetical protein